MLEAQMGDESTQKVSRKGSKDKSVFLIRKAQEMQGGLQCKHLSQYALFWWRRGNCVCLWNACQQRPSHITNFPTQTSPSTGIHVHDKKQAQEAQDCSKHMTWWWTHEPEDFCWKSREKSSGSKTGPYLLSEAGEFAPHLATGESR